MKLYNGTAHLASPRAQQDTGSETEHLLRADRWGPRSRSRRGGGGRSPRHAHLHSPWPVLVRLQHEQDQRPPPILPSAPPLPRPDSLIRQQAKPRISPDPCQTMAGADADPAIATSTCAHCHREVPSSNIALHSAHCARKLQKCEHCGDMVPRKLMDEHYDENHAPMNCSLCKSTVERDLWDLHTGIQCPQRMLACQYCEFELPAVDLFEHQDVCGNRTKYCQPCRKYIRLREWIGHELQFHTGSNAAADLSSDRAPAPAAEQPIPKPARPTTGSQGKQLLLAIAITGVAVLIGSILYQRKGQ